TSGAAFFYQATASGLNVTTSAPSNNDEASTLSFTSVSSGATVSFSQFEELRSGMNAIRAAWGDVALSWPDILNQNVNSCSYGTVSAVPMAGQDVYAAHLIRLRCAMDNALARGGVTRGAYTDPDLT